MKNSLLCFRKVLSVNDDVHEVEGEWEIEYGRSMRHYTRHYTRDQVLSCRNRCASKYKRLLGTDEVIFVGVKS